MSDRRIAVRRRIRHADPATVWEALSDIAAHVEWMADAEAIRFTSPQEEGVGTGFDCDTKVGPFRLRDQMRITEWVPERAMSVRHVGIVTGEGRFSLRQRRRGTEVRWEETLQFPWWIPAVPAAAALHLIWRGNLRRLERTLPIGGSIRAGRGVRRRARRHRPRH